MVIETFNVIDVNTEYCVKDGKLSFGFIFIQCNGILFKNCDFRILDINRTSIKASKFIILHFKGAHNAYALF